MENTRERPGEWDALPKLRPGEPYFALIGRDRLAPPLIMDWADKNRRRALEDREAGKITHAQLADELRKATNAEMLAADMQAYKAGHEAETRPEAMQAKPTYTGHQLPPDTQRRDLEQMARTRANSAIHNSIAELTAAAEGLDKIANTSRDVGLLAGAYSDLHMITKALREVADRVTPPRPALER